MGWAGDRERDDVGDVLGHQRLLDALVDLVGGGLVAPTLGGRLFVDLLGRATAALAAASDEVVQVVAGLPRRLR